MNEHGGHASGGEMPHSGLGRFAHSLEAFLKPIYTWFGYLGALALGILIVAMAYSIIGRRFFNSPLPASTELMKLSLVLMTYTVIAIEHMGHHEKMTVDIIVKLFPRKLQEIIAPIVYVLVVGILSVLCWQLIALAVNYRRYHQTLGNIKLEIYPFTFLAAFGIFTLITVYIVRLLRAIDRTVNR